MINKPVISKYLTAKESFLVFIKPLKLRTERKILRQKRGFSRIAMKVSFL